VTPVPPKSDGPIVDSFQCDYFGFMSWVIFGFLIHAACDERVNYSRLCTVPCTVRLQTKLNPLYKRCGLVYTETFDDVQIVRKFCALCLFICFMCTVLTWDSEITVLFSWRVRYTEFYFRPTCTGIQVQLSYNECILWQIENNWRMWNISTVWVECAHKIKSRIVIAKATSDRKKILLLSNWA